MKIGQRIYYAVHHPKPYFTQNGCVKFEKKFAPPKQAPELHGCVSAGEPSRLPKIAANSAREEVFSRDRSGRVRFEFSPIVVALVKILRANHRRPPSPPGKFERVQLATLQCSLYCDNAIDKR